MKYLLIYLQKRREYSLFLKQLITNIHPEGQTVQLSDSEQLIYSRTGQNQDHRALILRRFYRAWILYLFTGFYIKSKVQQLLLTLELIKVLFLFWVCWTHLEPPGSFFRGVV